MSKTTLRILLPIVCAFLLSCASLRSSGKTAGEGNAPPPSKVPASAIQGTPFGPADEFAGSPYETIGVSGLFDAHPAETCQIAVLANGDDSFAARIQALEKADTSIRIQALVFTGDESGLHIAELLKAKKALGLDVRVIVDAMSNPGVQTQWMYFDLKQNGVEVKGYEGNVLKDMVATFDRNVDYFLKVKESRGIFNTNIYWGASRHVFEKTGKIHMRHVTDERLNGIVREMADKKLDLKYDHCGPRLL